MTQKTDTPELEIDAMETTSSLPAKPDALADIEPIGAEVMNQKTGEFERVMISPHDIQRYICPTATLPELYIFMSICRQQGIDPISEAYFVKFKDQPGFTVMKYTVYLKRAMKSGVIKSLRHEFDDEENPTKITVYLERNDMPGEWVWTTYRSEVEKRRSDGKVTAIWGDQLRFMMTKCGYSQMLRFFCADVVGALPPIQEEMPGIGALNMPTTGPDSPALAEWGKAEEEEIAGEVLEVKDVEHVPEHLDMTPLRHTYFGMIEGLFKDDADRKAWQLETTGVESCGQFGLPEYAKIFKGVAKLVGPPNGEKEAEEEQPKTADGTPVDEAVKDASHEGVEKTEHLNALRKEYEERVKGRFPTPVHRETWQKANIGEADSEKWVSSDFHTALALLKQADEELVQAKSAEIELRNEYIDLLLNVFQSSADTVRWQKHITGEENFEKWDTDQFRTGIQELNDFKELDAIAQQFVNLRLLYEERVEGRFANAGEEAEWAYSVTQKSGDPEQWGIVHYQMLLAELDKLDGLENQEPVILNEFIALGDDVELYPDDKGTVVRAKVTDIRTDVIEIEFDTGLEKKQASFSSADVQEWLKEGKWKIVQVDDGSAQSTTTQETTEDDTEPLMTTDQFKELKEITADLPAYHRNLGSTEFRARCQDITGKRPRSIRQYTEAEASDLIQELTDERENYLKEQKEKAENAQSFFSE